MSVCLSHPVIVSFIIVQHCRILFPDGTEWRFVSAALCGRRRCFVADQLWFMTRIREEEDCIINSFIHIRLMYKLTYSNCRQRENKNVTVSLLQWRFWGFHFFGGGEVALGWRHFHLGGGTQLILSC